MKYNFLYTSDCNYFNHMYLSIYSLLKNNIYPLTVHIIEFNFTKEQIEKLEKLFNLYDNASLKFYPMIKLENIMNKFSIPKWRETDIANARLFSGEIIEADKVLYIDCDTIITSSLKDVFNVSDYPISAVREMKVPSHIEDRLESYYNTGVLLIDYKLCYDINLLKLIHESLNTTVSLVFPDQDLLNLALNERIGVLSPNYNINPLTYDMIFNHPIISKKYLDERSEIFYKRNELIEAYRNPKIYHLLEYMHSRPWIKNNVHVFNKIYAQYSKEAFEKIEKVTQNDKIYSILASTSLFPMISMLLEVMPFEDDFKIKDKIRKIIYFNRK